MMSRGNMEKWFMVAALVIVMVAAGEVRGIRAASAAPTAKSIKLRMMLKSEPSPRQMNPTTGFGSSVAEPIVSNVHEPLVDVGQKGEFVPKLATKWEHSADLTKWRFYLRKGVKFQNGANFSARDVVEYIKWNFEEKNLSKVLARIPIKEVVAVDDYTVDFTFEKPQPLFLIAGRKLMIPPVAVSTDKKNREMAGAPPFFIGTGPYKLVEWNRGMSIKLVKFEGYWGPKPQIDEVEILFRGEEAVRLSALMAREVDWVDALGTESARTAPKVAQILSQETVWLQFDEYIQKELGGVSILADKRLRQAVDYAIDRKALVAMYEGYATPSLGQFASPGDFGFNPDLKSRPYDIERAKALVREAGAVGKTVTFVAPTDRWAKCREVAEAVAYMIEKTGLKVKLMLMPETEATRYSSVRGEDRKIKADILISPTDLVLEVETKIPELFIEGGRNFALNDTKPESLYKEAVAEADLAKRGEKVAKTYTYLYEQAHYVPIFKLKWIWGIAKNLEWKVDIAGRPFFADMRFTD